LASGRASVISALLGAQHNNTHRASTATRSFALNGLLLLVRMRQTVCKPGANRASPGEIASNFKACRIHEEDTEACARYGRLAKNPMDCGLAMH
jgi:hypothetical protein